MAAVMDGAILASPSLDTSITSDGVFDEHFLAEEREAHKRRLEYEFDEQADSGLSEEVTAVHAPEERIEKRAKLLELMGKSQAYSGFLADQFMEMVEQTMKAAANGTGADGGSERPAKRAKSGRGKKAAAAEPPTATQRLLPMIKAELRDYQLRGVAWLISLYKNGVNGILADEMGLGKTLQTISFISFVWAYTQSSPGKYLVVGPLSTLSNWVAEFNRFCPDIPVVLYHGSPQERDELRRTHMNVQEGEQMPVIITSYEIVMADRRHLERHDWKLLVVDEGHRLKNFDCKLIKELRALRTESRLLLTGTPLQNNLRELFSLLSFCMPSVFPDADEFMSWFDFGTPNAAIPAAVMAPRQAASGSASSVAAEPGAEVGTKAAEEPEKPAGKGRGRRKVAKKSTVAAKPEGQAAGTQDAAGAAPHDGPVTTAAMVSRLHAILKPFVLRRVKADVNIGVPPKQEIVLYAEMTDEQRRLTQGLIDGTLKEELAKESGLRGHGLNNLIMQMRKVCNHPDLITGRASGSNAYPPASELVAQCGKLALLDRLLKQLRQGGHRVLIFSQMTEMLNVIEAYLSDLGIEALRIDGSVPWQNRKDEIAEFQSGNSSKWVFLLSTRAGGLGINLTAADTVIIYDSDWNPHQDAQAMDRCHRIGQTKPVLVFRLVTANSVENRMLARAESKKALERIVIKKGAFKELLQTASSTSEEELLQLLNPDRRSTDLAQSGVVSDSVLAKLLDRSHLMTSPPGPGTSQPPAAKGKQRAAKGAKRGKAAAGAGPSQAVAPSGPAPPPYPLVGVGYEVVVDEPNRAVGLLQRIDGEDGKAPAEEAPQGGQ